MKLIKYFNLNLINHEDLKNMQFNIHNFLCCLHYVLYYTDMYKLKYKIILKAVQKKQQVRSRCLRHKHT